MTTSPSPASACAHRAADPTAAVERVVITDDALIVEFRDGRGVSAPIEWYPRLVHARRQERDNWRLIGDGRGIRWEDLDEDIGIVSMLAGRRSTESPTSFRRWLAGRI